MQGNVRLGNGQRLSRSSPSSEAPATVIPTLKHAATTPEPPPSPALREENLILSRYARNKRLADALFQQAFSALTASPGAHAFYDSLRVRDIGHYDALRRLSDRLVGILHGCMRHGTTSDEATAWPPAHKKKHDAA
jgi:hypothetical protein